MRCIRSFAPFLFGFTLATLAGLLLRLSPAMAQQAVSDISIARPPILPARSARPLLRPTIDDDETARAPSIPSASAETPRQPITAVTLSNGRAAPAPVRAQQDGETEPPVSEELAVDGHMEVVEKEVPNDGIEPFVGDPRLPADAAAFLSPPAGYDMLAFQIELDPTNDARTTRLARFEPFAPDGRRAGSWVIYSSVEAGVTGTNNAFSATPAKPDLIFDVRPTLLAVTNWERHALQFKATALGTANGTFSSEDTRAYGFESRGRIDISKQTTIEILAAHSLDQEARSSTFAPTDTTRPTPYVTDKLAVVVNQRFNRYSIQLRGAITATDYQSVPTYDGGVLSSDERDLLARDVAIRTAWNFSPSLAAFSETALNSQTYRAVPTDGISRNSTGDRVRAGVSFGSASQIWRGEISTGYGHQYASDARLADAGGVLLDANLGWRPTQITSVLFNAHTDFVTSTLVGQGNASQRIASLEVRHAFQRQLNGIAKMGYQVTNFQGVSLTERTTSGELGMEYYLSRSTTLLGRYTHAVVASTATDTATTTDSVRLGVRYAP